MKNLRRFFLVLFVFTAVFTFAACSDGASGGENNKTTDDVPNKNDPNEENKNEENKNEEDDLTSLPDSKGTNELNGRTLTCGDISFTFSEPTFTFKDGGEITYDYTYDSKNKIIYALPITYFGYTYEELAKLFSNEIASIYFSIEKYKYELGDNKIVASLTPLASNKWYYTCGFQSDGYSSGKMPYIYYNSGYYFYTTYSGKQYCFNIEDGCIKFPEDKVKFFAIEENSNQPEGVPVDETDYVIFSYTVETNSNKVTIKNVPIDDSKKEDLVLTLSDKYVYYDDSAQKQ